MQDKRLAKAHSLLSTAVESGIAYWVELADEFRWEDDVDGDIVVSPITILKCWDEPDDERSYRNRPISAESIVTALKTLSEDAKMPTHLRTMAFGVLNDEDYDYDACDADVIFQYALFGEVIFG